MGEWVATNISISERAARWRLFTIGQALIGAIRFAFVLRLSLNQPVSLRFFYRRTSSPNFHVRVPAAANLVKMALFKHGRRACSLELQYGRMECKSGGIKGLLGLCIL